MSEKSFVELNSELWFQVLSFVDTDEIKVIKLTGGAEMILKIDDKPFLDFLSSLEETSYQKISFKSKTRSFIDSEALFKYSSKYSKHYLLELLELRIKTVGSYSYDEGTDNSFEEQKIKEIFSFKNIKSNKSNSGIMFSF